MPIALAIEYETYLAARNQLITEGHLGERVCAVREVYCDALETGYTLFGMTPFLVYRIMTVGPASVAGRAQE